MAYNWPEFQSTSAFYHSLKLTHISATPLFSNLGDSFFIGLGDPTNNWNQQNRSLNGVGIPVNFPIINAHPIFINPSGNSRQSISSALSTLPWSQGNLDIVIKIERTFNNYGVITTTNDDYRVLQKYEVTPGIWGLVLLPAQMGIITGVKNANGTHIKTWKDSIITVQGINLGRFNFSYGYNNLTGLATNYVFRNDQKAAFVRNPIGSGLYGYLEFQAAPYWPEGQYPHSILGGAYSQTKTFVTIESTLNLPVLSISPNYGPDGTSVTLVSTQAIDTETILHMAIAPAHASVGQGANYLYKTEQESFTYTGSKSNTFSIVNDKTFTFNNPITNFTYRPYIAYDFVSGLSGYNILSAPLFYKPILINEYDWVASVPGSFTIEGTNIADATTVKINNESVNFSKAGNGAFIYVVTNANTTSGVIEITSPAGTVTSSKQVKLQAAPTISSFTPTNGLSGAQVTITGTNFTSVADSTKSVVTSVRFNNSPAVFDEVTSTTIRAFVPSAATGKITVITSGGTATSESNFTQVFPPSGNLHYKDYYGNLGQQINKSAGGNPIFTGSEYYISGGSLDTLQSVSFRYTSVPSLNYTAPNSLLYQAEFTKVSASLAKVVIPQMNNTSEFGYVLLRLVNAYGQHETGYYRLEPVLANINFPTINSYQELPNDNTTSVNTLVGANAFFNKDNSWQKTTDIYFAKPTTRKDGLTENSEWTRATGAWFSNNGEWQKFWPSIENAAKLFYKFDWASAGFDGKIDVIKTVPDFPNIYALLSQYNGTPEFSTGAKSIIAKINLQTGTLSYIEVKGVHDSNTCHISDIYVTSDSVYAVGYDFTTAVTYFGGGGSNGVNTYNLAPARFVEMTEHIFQGTWPFNTSAPFSDQNIIGTNSFCGIVKKYSKNLNLQFSRAINQANQSFPSTRFAFKCGHRIPGTFQYFTYGNTSAPIPGELQYISIQGSMMEPKISFYNNAIYVFIPVTEQFSSSGQTLYTYLNDDPSSGLLSTAISGVPVRESILIKKLKATNLTEFTNETSVKQLMSHTRNVPGINGETYLYPSAPQYEFFRRYKKSGISQYSVFADQQLNGNNKITFKNGFYWNSLQINPVIRSAYLSRDGSLDYSLIIGNLESETGDDDTNGMLVGLYGKNDLFDQMCGTEFELGKETTSEVITYSGINSFLANYASLPNVYTPTSFPVTAFTVTETLNDNGGTGFPMTQVCNA